MTTRSLFRSLALAAAVALLAAPGPALTAAPAAAAGAPTLVLMTFNIRYATARDGPDAWEHRRELLAGVIRDADPDVVGLQEALAPQLEDLARLLPHYSRLGVGRDDGKAAGEHCAILYRTDRFEVGGGGTDHGTFWLSDTPEAPGSKSWGNTITRICTWARLVERDGEGGGDARPQGFYIFNAHLDHQSQPSRERSIELIAARLRAREHPDAPAVLMGDLNAGERNPVVRYATGEAERASADPAAAPPPSPRLVNALRAADPGAVEVGTFHGFKGGRDGDMIDYILVPRDARVLSCRIIRARADDGRYPSDHFPVVARVELDAAEPSE